MVDRPKQDRKLKLPKVSLGKREVFGYTADLAVKICELIAEGHTLKEICEDKENFPSRQTVHRWVVMYPEFARSYAAARELSAYSMEEEALALGRQLSSRSVPKDQIRALEVAMNQLRWSASKRNARVFGDRPPVNLTVPIQINTALDLGPDKDQGSSVSEEHPNIYTIEATVELPQDPTADNKFDPYTEMQADAEPLTGKTVRKRKKK